MDAQRNIPYYRPENFYPGDLFFQRVLQRYLPPEELAWAEEYLDKMGRLAAEKITPLVLISDQNPPELISYDPTGKRIDRIQYHDSYRTIAKLVYEFGIIGLGHTREFREKKRFYGPLLKFALGYLFSQAGSVLYCPICMTDGTLQLVERYGSEELKKQWIPRLTSTDLNIFCDGGMYLTEAQGGSDVGANTSRAYQEQGEWKISGEKWFCSNVGSATAMVLARPDGAPEGTKGLGLFLVPWKLENGNHNSIRVNRIKPKLGTCEMATGEIELQGAVGFPVGDLESGFAYMTDMLNLSRTYNAVWCIGLMRRAYLEADHYARNRKAFGKNIADYPLVAQALQRMKTDTEKATALTFECISHMDRLERGNKNETDAAMLRLLTPVIKFYTAEKCIESAHRAIEIFAGNGCIEDFPVAKMLRDSQILAIWEGTANILSLDLLRAMKKTSAHETFLEVSRQQIEKNLPASQKEVLKEQWASLKKDFEEVLEGKDGYGGELQCRELATHLAQFVQELIWRQLR